MKISFQGSYIEGLLLVQPPREFNVCDGFKHFHISTDEVIITETGDCKCHTTEGESDEQDQNRHHQGARVE